MLLLYNQRCENRRNRHHEQPKMVSLLAGRAFQSISSACVGIGDFLAINRRGASRSFSLSC